MRKRDKASKRGAPAGPSPVPALAVLRESLVVVKRRRILSHYDPLVRALQAVDDVRRLLAESGVDTTLLDLTVAEGRAPMDDATLGAQIEAQAQEVDAALRSDRRVAFRAGRLSKLARAVAMVVR